METIVIKLKEEINRLKSGTSGVLSQSVLDDDDNSLVVMVGLNYKDKYEELLSK